MEEAIKNYLDDNKRVKVYPSKRKYKLLVLEYIQSKFEHNKEYSEKEVNNIINEWTIFNDAATIRREMYVYRYINRTLDCSKYWL